METYKSDDSFFMGIKIPFSYVGVNEIKFWFQSVPLRNNRLIVDQELDEKHANLEERLSWYPGIKTIGVVMNPWARARLSYLHISNNQTTLNRLASLEFNDFVSYMETIQLDDTYGKWYHPLTPQLKWVQSKDKKADYIFKAETLDNNFKVIQDYFITDDKLTWYDTIPDYKEHYTKKSVDIIYRIFKEDVEAFEYEF